MGRMGVSGNKAFKMLMGCDCFKRGDVLVDPFPNNIKVLRNYSIPTWWQKILIAITPAYALYRIKKRKDGATLYKVKLI